MFVVTFTRYTAGMSNACAKWRYTGGMQMENQVRTELVAFRLTPIEKLRLMQAARRPKYQGSISALLRDLLTSENDKSAQVIETDGALVTNN